MSEQQPRVRVLIKRAWPHMSMNTITAFQWPNVWFTLHIVFISNLLFPGEPFHPELNFAFGLMFIIGAFSKLFWGTLADKYSRTKLIAIQAIGESVGFISFAYLLGVQGTNSFYFLLIGIVIRECFTGEMPIFMSYLDDTIEQDHKSQYFGAVGLIGSLYYTLVCIFSSLVFQVMWQQYFLIFGSLGIGLGFLILTKAKEPKRGGVRSELKSILKLDSVQYQYKLTKDTIRRTIFSPTNCIVLFEGILSQMTLAVPMLLLYSFFESAPYNIAPFSMIILATIFGIPGSVIGSTVLAKYSDKLGKKNIKYRVYLIFLALVIFYLNYSIVFFLPYPSTTITQGNDLGFLFGIPIYWLLGFLVLIGNIMGGVYGANQPPIIQQLNLPEAQGVMASANTFLEILGAGIGAILSGIILLNLGNNYRETVLILMILGICGSLLWILTLKWIGRDTKRISEILVQRAEEMQKK